MLHLINKRFIDAQLTLDSALNYQNYKTSAVAWLRKGEIAFNLLNVFQENEKNIFYINESIHAFERAKFLDTGKTTIYNQANDYLEKVWEKCLINALGNYDRGEHALAILFCNKAKEIFPEDMNAYLYAGQAADKLQDYTVVRENYYKLIYSGYLRKAIVNRLLELETEIENEKQVIVLLDLAANEWDADSYDYFIKKITYYHKIKVWSVAKENILKSEYYQSANSELLLLLAKSYVYNNEYNKAIKVLKKIKPISDQEKTAKADVYFFIGKTSYASSKDKDGNYKLSGKTKEYFSAAREMYSNIVFTEANTAELSEKIMYINSVFKGID